MRILIIGTSCILAMVTSFCITRAIGPVGILLSFPIGFVFGSIGYLVAEDVCDD